MEEIIPNLYVGSDDDFFRAKARNFAIVTAAKDGPHGHRSVLGYTSMAAPKGANYYFVKKGNHLALNLIDADDPAFIPEQPINEALDFIDEHLKAGHKVLVQCNKGVSRSPSIVMLYLRRINDLPDKYREGFGVFRKLYPKFKPGLGMESYIRKHYKVNNGEVS